MEDEVFVCRKMSGTPFVDDHPRDFKVSGKSNEEERLAEDEVFIGRKTFQELLW